MKARCIFIIMISVICAVSSLYSQTATQNYILARTYTSETGTHLDQIQYFDGLGRPNQLVQKGISPTSKDLVTLQEYDNFNRESNAWLPAVITGNGNYVDPTVVKTGAIASNGGDQRPYSLPTYEASPLSRVVRQFGPGADWQNNGQAADKLYTTNQTNNVTSCLLYKVGGTRQAPTISVSNNYPASVLYVVGMKDENGITSYEFKDKLGQVVLTRQIYDREYYDTYYVYDDFGNLCFVLPPLIATDVSTTNLNLLAYQYRYDNRNRCIWKKLPGCEPVYYIYDKADRMIFTQDGEQRAKNPKEWTFTIPDALGRTVLTGICKNSLDYTADPLKTVVVKATYNKNRKNLADSYSISGISLYIPSILSASYYDNYNFIGMSEIPNNSNVIYSAETGYGTQYAVSYKDLLTGTLTAQINPDGSISSNYLYSCIYYDNKKQLIQTKSNNHLGGTEKEFIVYNFTGKPTQKKHVHTKDANGGGSQTEIYTYKYDHAGRLTKTTYQLNSGIIMTLAENTYDEQGRLLTNKKGGQDKLQSTYAYNVRSWTKSISGPLFSQTLFYNESYGGSTKQYNGNVSGMNWTINGDKTRGYAFFYDNVSRLQAANYFEGGVPSTNYKTSYTYDRHGNIKTLQRYGKTTASAYGLIDNLTFDYTGTGNRLKGISDAIGTISLAESADFKNYSNVATEYTYNTNGAMTKDLNKGISDIQYNSLNLPRRMDIKSPVAEARNEYTYSAGGQKLKVVHKWNPYYSTAPVIGSAISTSALTQTKTTDYVGNMIYENNTLKRVLVDGGYMEGGSYYYYLTDHLGNNRIVANQGGAVIQKNHYYPFGTAFAETSITEQGKQPYKYNDKELDQMNGLNHYDYEARYYDPAYGRFTTMDPKAEKYYSISPYAYCMNNPIKYIDPDGRSGIPIINKENKTITVHSKFVFYGGEANTKLSQSIANEIATQYNGARGKVTVDGVEYRVNFKISYQTVTEAEAIVMAENNDDAKVNFLRVEKNNSRNKISFFAIGENNGFLNTDDDLGTSMTASHEVGHGYGLFHSEGNQMGKGKGQPDIMSARGTIVDPQYRSDPKAAILAPGGTINPAIRRVTQKNITDMFKGITFDANGRGQIGTATNRTYNANGYEQ